MTSHKSTPTAQKVKEIRHGWNPALGIIVSPTTQVLDSDGRDWAWAYVIFREIPDYPGYLAGSDGTIWTCWCRGNKPRQTSLWKLMSPAVNDRFGHLMIGICRKGKRKPFLVHHLILMAFTGPRPPGLQCRHLNGKGWDNRIENLKWGTSLENYRDMINHGTSRVAFGENAATAVLTEQDIPEIFRLRAEGMKYREIRERYKINHGAITAILYRRSWKHVYVPPELIGRNRRHGDQWLERHGEEYFEAGM